MAVSERRSRCSLTRTLRLATFWNRTKRNGIRFPSATWSSVSSMICAASGSFASCASSKPIVGRFTKILIRRGYCAGSPELLSTMARTRTPWLNYQSAVDERDRIRHNTRLTATLRMSCSSTSLRRYEFVVLNFLSSRMLLIVCSASSFRQLSCWLSKASSSEVYVDIPDGNVQNRFRRCKEM